MVRLGECVAMPRAALRGEQVATPHRAIGDLAVALHPARQGGANVEVKQLVVVADPDDVPVHDMGVSVGRVRLAQDALVPVVKRRGARLRSDEPGPGIFAWRLVEVAVDYYVA